PAVRRLRLGAGVRRGRAQRAHRAGPLPARAGEERRIGWPPPRRSGWWAALERGGGARARAHPGAGGCVVRRAILVFLALLILAAGVAGAATRKKKRATHRKKPAAAHVVADAGAVEGEVAPADAGPPDAGIAAPVEPQTVPVPIPVPVPIEKARKPPAAVGLQLAPPPPEPKRVRRAPTAFEAITAIIGLVAVVGMAYLASHPKVQELEELLGITAVVAAGFPFVLFGLIGGKIGILSDSVLDYLRPFIPLGLGWVGFSIGFRFDVRRLEALPRGVGPTLLLTSVLPFAAIAGA